MGKSKRPRWNVAEWQKQFRSGPVLYWTSCLGEPTGNFYDSREGAELERDWNAAKKDSYTYPKIVIHSTHVHTHELAQQRWEASDDPTN